MIKIGSNKLIMTDERGEGDESAIEQIIEMVKHPAFEHEKVRIMPDYHKGTGAVIGFTSTYSDLIIPNVVGVDIGCGVLSYNIGKVDVDYEQFDKEVRKRIPSGFNRHPKLGIFEKYDHLYDDWLLKYDPNEFNKRFPHTKLGDIRLQIGTLGGGNHFIEIEQDEKGNKYITIHSGSRNFGLKIANHFQKMAKNMMKKYHIKTTQDLEYLITEEGGGEYLFYMGLAQHFAQMNRKVMMCECLEVLGQPYLEANTIESVHNYIDLKQRIIRKGAIKVLPNTEVVIPLNMKDGIIVGKGVSDGRKLENWNFSAPHGAGRVMGRNVAKKTLDFYEFRDSMKGIFSSCFSSKILDEAPKAYKDSNKIIESVREVVDIEKVIKPVYSLKSD